MQFHMHRSNKPKIFFFFLHQMQLFVKKNLVGDMTGLLHGKFRFVKLFLICIHKTKMGLVTWLTKILMNHINQSVKERDQLHFPQVRIKLN